MSYIGNNTCIIDRYVCSKTYLQNLSCLLYHFYFCSFFRLSMFSYTTLSFPWLFTLILTLVAVFPSQVSRILRRYGHVTVTLHK